MIRTMKYYTVIIRNFSYDIHKFIFWMHVPISVYLWKQELKKVYNKNTYVHMQSSNNSKKKTVCRTVIIEKIKETCKPW